MAGFPEPMVTPLKNNQYAVRIFAVPNFVLNLCIKYGKFSIGAHQYGMNFTPPIFSGNSRLLNRIRWNLLHQISPRSVDKYVNYRYKLILSPQYLISVSMCRFSGKSCLFSNFSVQKFAKKIDKPPNSW